MVNVQIFFLDKWFGMSWLGEVGKVFRLTRKK